MATFVDSAVGQPQGREAPPVEPSGIGLRVIEREAALAPPSGGESTNVVPFLRARRADGTMSAAPAVVAVPADRPAPAAAPAAASRARWAAWLACSVAAHVALYLPLDSEPPPMASIGLDAVSVEIVLGANENAGPAHDSSAAETAAPPAASAEPPAEPPPAEPEPQTVEPTPVEPPRVETAAVETAPAQPVEMPAAEPAPAPSVEKMPAAPPPPTVRQPAPAIVAPQPKRPAAKPPAARPAQPEGSRANGAGKPSESRSTAAASPAGGAGRGRSDLNTNYPGLVSAHLARHKQYPAEARSSRIQGSAVVTFSLSGSGAVTSVRLARGSGVASLDAEATAMVRRASPFPAPPDGRPASFTVPVSFRLN